MRCCVLQHLAFEDLGTFAPVLLETGWTIQACHVADGLPDARDWRDADLCIVLGGPMGVHDGAAYPFLSRELELVRSRLGEGRPLLGICLGAQLMAQALGAAVYAGKAKEIGWAACSLRKPAQPRPWQSCAGPPCCTGTAIPSTCRPPPPCWPPRTSHPIRRFRQGQASWPCNSMPRPTPPAWSTGSWAMPANWPPPVWTWRPSVRMPATWAAVPRPPDKISSAAG